jgi:hypothetical protein
VQADSQLLADPGFEYGSTFWTLDICTVINPAGCTMNLDYGLGGNDFGLMSFQTRNGKGRVALGGPTRTFDVMSEVLNIPANLSRAELSVYLWVVTKGNKKTATDLLTVEIRDKSGVLLETVGTFSNLDESPTYSKRRFDVSRYRGATIRIAFKGVQKQGPPTWFLLDDAALNVWR